MQTTDIIIKIRDGFTLPQVAAAVNALIGKGGLPDAEQVENMLGFVNTPEVNGYVRVRIDSAYLATLQVATADPSAPAEIVAVNPIGHFQVGEENGNPIYLGEFA